MAKNTQTANILLTMDGKQAEKWLEILAKKSETLRDDIRSLNKQRITIGLTGEEAKKFDALKKEYRDTHRQTRELAKQLADVSGVINKLSTTPIKAIKDAIKAVTAQMERLDRGTEKYAQRQKQLKVLREELDRISSSGKKNVGVFDQIGATIKRLAAYVLVYAGFNKLTEGLSKMYDMNVALSDQLSDIEKTTGITGRSLSELSDDINRIDTRTPVEELNKLAVAAGKIGIQGKEDVLEFVKAGNIINVALGEDLGEDAIKNIAKLNDVLGITKELGVEKSLLATGSAINELGQNSTASEGYLVDFAQRLGGIAAQAGLTVQQVLALGSASDQMGQNVEVSATALNKMITTIVSKTGQVAKAIGVTKDELQGMLDKSTWDALLFVFEKLAGKGGLAAIAPLMGDLGSDGARLTQVISALASNTDKLNREIGISNKAFAEATSVVNEYDKKNNNLAGTIEKIGKNIQRWFLGSKFVDWMLDVAKVIEDITGYTNDANIRFKDQSKVVKNLISNTNPLIEEYKRLQDSKTEESQQRLKDVILEIQKAIPGAVSEFDQYGNAIKISTDRAEAFIRVQKIQLQQMNKEAIKSTQTDLDRANFQLKQLEAKQKEIEKRGTYTIQNAPTFGGYVTYRDASSKEVENVTRKYMEQRKEIKSLEAVIHELKGDYIEEMLIAERVQQLKDDYRKKWREQEKKDLAASQELEEERKARIKQSLADADAYIDKEKTALIQARINKQKYRDEDISSETKYNQMLEKIEYEGLEKKLAIAGLDKDKRAEVERQFYDLKLRLFNKTETETRKYLDDLDKMYDQFELKGVSRDQRELVRIQQKYNDATLLLENALKKDLITQEEYNTQIENLRQKEKEAEDEYFKEKSSKDAAKEVRVLNQEQSSEELKASELRLKGVYTESEYKAKLLEIEIEYQEKRLAVNGLTEEQITELKRKNADRQIALMDQSSRKQEQIQQAYANVLQNSLSGIGDAFANLFSSGEDGMKQMGDAIVDIAFDTLGQLAEIWIKEMTVSATANIMKGQAQEIGSKGLLGVATGAAISGIVMGLLSVAKAGIKALIGGSKTTSTQASTGQRVVKSSGYSVGGYSGDGDTYEVAGIVHKGEYIVPKWQMQDPVSFDYVRALETIRQSRTITNPLPRNGYAEGGPAEIQVPTNQAVDPEMKATLKGIQEFLAYLKTNGVYTNLNVSNLNKTQERLSASRARGSLKK